MDIENWYYFGRAELLAIHRDEGGENNMSTVMILAIAAFVGAGIFLFGKSIYTYALNQYKQYTTGGATALPDPGK